MGRKTLQRVNNFPYHVTIRSNNKEWFDLPMDQIWKICIRSLCRARYKYPVKIEVFVLMGNHYHLLLYTPDADIDKFMHSLNSLLSKEIRSISGRINRIFGDRYKWSIVNCDKYYQNVIRYILQNPVRANIVKHCQDYKYSTLYYQVRNKQLPITLPEYFVQEDFLNFINKRISQEKSKIFHKKIRQNNFIKL